MTEKTKTTQEKMEKKSYPLRLDTDLYVQVRESSKQEGRSINRQIEFLLRQGLKQRPKK